MNRDKKEEIVTQLTKRLSQSPNIYFTDFTGVTVKSITDFRRRLRAAGVEYTVVKNTLALRAMEAASVSGVGDVMAGPTGFVFAGDNPVAAAQVLAEFSKQNEAFTVKAGLVSGRRVTAADVKRLASLPSRDEMLGQMAGLMQAPLQGFLGALHGLLYQMVGVLDALREQRATAEPQA
jgi:large subunit ribosomal protein L10